MPHNNRVSGSAALRTNDMWSKTIGHNPYAAGDEKAPDEGISHLILLYNIIIYVAIHWLMCCKCQWDAHVLL